MEFQACQSILKRFKNKRLFTTSFARCAKITSALQKIPNTGASLLGHCCEFLLKKVFLFWRFLNQFLVITSTLVQLDQISDINYQRKKISKPPKSHSCCISFVIVKIKHFNHRQYQEIIKHPISEERSSHQNC